MRRSLVIIALGAVLGGPAFAAPKVATVRVSIGQELARKTQIMDAREFDYLSRELKRSVETRLDRSNALDPEGGELDLVIEDARPNRPTWREMSAKPGLSYQSFGVGGARVSGEYRSASGARTPVAYGWYETDIRWAQYGSTWSDADQAFDRLATRLAKNQFSDR